jgi:hypothetical protein
MTIALRTSLFAFGARIISNPFMTQLTHIRLLDIIQAVYGQHAFISAASGLVQFEDRIYVIADDAQHLAIFTLNSSQPGRLIRLLPGDLPRDTATRKAVKPDFEILLQVPNDPDSSSFSLLALGSGSTERRMRGAIIAQSPDGVDATITILDLQPLFTALALLCADINLEAAVVRGDRLVLFNRGNMEIPMTWVFSTQLSTLLAGGAPDVILEKKMQLPFIGEVPLTVTDACRLDNGTTLLSAVAEATGDSYADGAIMAAAFVTLDDQFDIIRVDRIEPTCKIEGITAQSEEQGITVLCVSDADDPEKPSCLYAAKLDF